MPTRNDAWALLCEYTQNESLRKHALAVEACVRAYARKSGADEELWSLTALLHDFDYERWPNDAHSPTEEHPAGGSAILRERGYPEEMIRAIVSHADYCNVAARNSARTHSVRVRRTRRLPHRVLPGQTGQEHLRSRARFREAQAQGQSLRARRQSRRRAQRRGRAGRPHRGAHRLLHRRDARSRRRAGPARKSSGQRVSRTGFSLSAFRNARQGQNQTG